MHVGVVDEACTLSYRGCDPRGAGGRGIHAGHMYNARPRLILIEDVRTPGRPDISANNLLYTPTKDGFYTQVK